MSSSFTVNAVVWVYMEGYPWWPGLIMDPAAAAATLSEEVAAGKQAVMCLPSTAPSVVVVDPSNPAEVRSFQGVEEDAELIAAARASPDCAPAVEEALQFFAGEASDATNVAGADGTADADLMMLLDATDESGDVNHAGGETDEERRRRKREKKERKRREREAQQKQKKARKADSDDEASVDSDDDDDDDILGVGSKAHKSSKKKHRAEKPIADKMDAARKASKTQRTLDSYDMAASPKYSPADDIDYYYRKLREGRARPTNEQLVACARRIKEAVAEVAANPVVDDREREATLLDVLRPLKNYDVTMEQLKLTGIGVIVGTLLQKRFPYSAQQLAQAILLYWFRSLPASVQRKFTQLNEVDRCSTDTTVGTRSDDMNTSLSALGIHIFESFTEEELYDAPADVDAIVIAKSIEEALAERDRDERVMVLSMLGDASNTAIRRGVLDGKISAETLVQNAGDVRSLMRNLGIRATAAGKLRTGGLRIDTNLGTTGVVGTSSSPLMGLFSPQGEDGNTFGSPTTRGSANMSGGVTTLYACPNCGAHEAHRTVYTVSAHDNFPDILRCLKCDTTWNISDQ